MKILIDAVGVRSGSAAIVIGGVIRGWRVTAPGDEIVVLVDGHPDFSLPEGVSVVSLTRRETGVSGRLRAQTVGVRRACAAYRADGLLSAVPASALLGARCPHAVIVYDLRHELRPSQFSRGRRLSRRVLWGWSFRHADALMCISERTRTDLITLHPHLRRKAHTALLGVDHAASWAVSGEGGARYVLAFGHFAHKNITPVLRAWQTLPAGTEDVTLRICGLGKQARLETAALIDELGLSSRVELLGWLDDEEFARVFSAAGTVVFPSDFEGFGLPAVEALRLGVPVVISTDPALLEVTAGHAVVAADDSPETLAGAITTALGTSQDQRAAGIAHAAAFTWERCARQIRDALRAA